MQRISRMKRELEMMERAPPPGVSCWIKDGDLTRLEARKLQELGFLEIILIID